MAVDAAQKGGHPQRFFETDADSIKRCRARSVLTMARKITAALLLVAGLLWPVSCLPSGRVWQRGGGGGTYKPTPLHFRADGSFQISIFEDLHFGENAWDSWGPEQDVNSVKVLNTLLTSESPDLAVLNGDLITGENGFLENSTVYVDQIVGPLVARGLPWASTYGNHDSQYNLSGEAILARERRWPNALTRRMVCQDDAGVTNYYLPVYGSDCDVAGDVTGCVPRLVLWFFDSRGGHVFQQKGADGSSDVDRPDWVDAGVVAWFEQTYAALAARWAPATGVLPSLGFVHIPTYASLRLQQSAAGVDGHRQPGINDDNPLSPQAEGWCADGRSDSACTYGGQDVPFMRAIAQAGRGVGMLALFSGHDHGATWCYTWDRLLDGMTVAGTGVHLCFGQHTGYGGYGSWTRGGRQVRITETSLRQAALQNANATRPRRADIDTWIRLETGDVVGAVSLNATYGTDVYPETPDTKS